MNSANLTIYTKCSRTSIHNHMRHDRLRLLTKSSPIWTVNLELTTSYTNKHKNYVSSTVKYNKCKNKTLLTFLTVKKRKLVYSCCARPRATRQWARAKIKARWRPSGDNSDPFYSKSFFLRRMMQKLMNGFWQYLAALGRATFLLRSGSEAVLWLLLPFSRSGVDIRVGGALRCRLPLVSPSSQPFWPPCHTMRSIINTCQVKKQFSYIKLNSLTSELYLIEWG